MSEQGLVGDPSTHPTSRIRVDYRWGRTCKRARAFSRLAAGLVCCDPLSFGGVSPAVSSRNCGQAEGGGVIKWFGGGTGRGGRLYLGVIRVRAIELHAGRHLEIFDARLDLWPRRFANSIVSQTPSKTSQPLVLRVRLGKLSGHTCWRSWVVGGVGGGVYLPLSCTGEWKEFNATDRLIADRDVESLVGVPMTREK